MKPSLTLGPSRWFIGFLSTWLAFALLLAARSTLLNSPLPPPSIGLLLTGAILLIVWWWETAREQVRRLGPAPLVGFHVIRLFVGAYFLILYQRGVLPAEFAILAGWGDIAVGASAALVLWFCIPVRTLGQRYGLLVWNTIGLIDILLVLSNGIRLFASDPGIGTPFATFPLALLPLFVVPLVITSHVMLFSWYWRAGSPQPTEATAPR